MNPKNNHDTAGELQEFRLEQSREHRQIQKDTNRIKSDLSLQKKSLLEITEKINDIYPIVKKDIRKAEAYKIVGEDLHLVGSNWKFWLSILSVVISIIIGIRLLITK